MWRWSILFTTSSCSITEMEKKKSLILKLGKSKRLAEALHMTVSQSALENLAESCSNIENGELHVLISFSKHDRMVRSCPAPMKLMRALPWAPLWAWWDVAMQDGSRLRAAHAAWCLALAALGFQLQRGSLLHMIFLLHAWKAHLCQWGFMRSMSAEELTEIWRVDASASCC